ncbi:histidinol-phosphate transaminase [Anaeromicropila herbilytica]|uniref:Histidinol-phosphate aminotransferase n=1 Tax=Anaeromicropila herbilytica TaxID=2785025 RepID=A0A7R7EIH8_9FIRM|nr:histidinol-phosphate transaminase [Anaeromicropila herbilytica]BCN29800.1 histidinol-phosphate aminotransferase [Anaeromicropila herbilytica]
MKDWEKNIRIVEPYVPGEQPNFPEMIKLNTNENPYPPSPRVQKAKEELSIDILRLYPDPTSNLLVEELANYYGRKKEQVFVGVGSDDVLSVAFLTFLNSKKPILFPDITYSFYSVWADLYRIPYERPAVDENFQINKEDYYKENGGIIFANPNAPTSISVDLEFIEDILEHNQDVIVIVDEAYIDFGGISANSLIDRYENLLVVQTFSKSRSMAGMRIGFAMGNERLIKAMNDVKYSINSYTMNQPSLYLGVEAIKDEDYFRENINKIIFTRENTKNSLEKLGFDVLDSKTNFLFISHSQYKAEDIFAELRENKIFVRHFNLPRISNYLRVTVGTDAEMECFIRSIEEFLLKRA